MALTEDDDLTGAFDPFTHRDDAWTERVQDNVRDLGDIWHLKLSQQELKSGFQGVLVACERQDGTPAVLKLREPNYNQRAEAQATINFDGRGSVRLLEEAPERGAILLERVLPGETMLDLIDKVDDNEIVAGVIEKLRGVEPTEGLRSAAGQLRTWAMAIDDPPESNLMQPEQWRLASTLLRELATTQEGDGLKTVHGDLHTGNILRGTNEWIAIDAKGFVGRENFDVGWWTGDPTEKRDRSLRESFERRIDFMSNATGVDRVEIASWAYAFRSVVLLSRIRSNVGWDMHRSAAWVQMIWETGILKR